MRIRRLVFLLTLFFLPVTGFPPAQAQDDYDLFRQSAAGASLLYRGRQAYEYALLYNGTYYWESSIFSPGEVLYNGNWYRDVPLNIDAVRQELLLRNPVGLSVKILESQFVSECSFGGNRYLNLQFLYGPSAPAGYWQDLYDQGRGKVLVQVRKVLEQDLDGRKRDQTHYDGVFRLNIYQVFTYTADYLYISEAGEFARIRRRSDFLRQFDPSVRKEIRRHVRHLDNASYMPLERFCTEALKFVESR